MNLIEQIKVNDVSIDGFQGTYYTDNSEFIQVTTDSSSLILQGIKSDGTTYVAGDLLVDGDIINPGIQELIDKVLDEVLEEVEQVLDDATETFSYFEPALNPEWLNVTIDSEGKILGGRKVDGTIVENMPVDGINFTKDGMDKLQLDLIDSGFNPEVHVTPTQEQVDEAVNDWLDEHPEATTTVQDRSITVAKLELSLAEKAECLSVSREGDPAYNGAGDIILGGNNMPPEHSTGHNIIIGVGNMMRGTKDAFANIALGYHSLFRQRDGQKNISIGNEAMDNASHGNGNTAIGANALRVQRYLVYGGQGSDVNIEGETLQGNTAIGEDAMYIFRGNNNIAIGREALRGQDIGNWNRKEIDGDTATYGNNNMCIGCYSGEHQSKGATTDDERNNSFYLDNLYRGSLVNEQSNGMMYGKFNTEPSQQMLRINTGLFILPYLPSSDPQVQGALWNDNGILKISNGN